MEGYVEAAALCRQDRGGEKDFAAEPIPDSNPDLPGNAKIETAPGPKLSGHIDLLNHRQVKGWATEERDGVHHHPSLEVVVDGRTVGRLTPSVYRGNLERRGMGDGTFGFSFTFPTLIGSDSVVELVSENGGKLATGGGTRADFGPELRGHVEVINHHEIKGWASEIADGEYRHPNLSVTVDGQIVGRVTPSQFRGYLVRGGVGDGTFGFSFRFPALVRKNSVVEVVSDSGARLGTSPRTLIGFAPDYPTMIVHMSDFDDGALLAATRVALYVTYSCTGRFHSYQRAQVSELQSAGYYVVGIHAAGDPSADWLSSRLCDADIFKTNEGYDFGSWCAGIQWLDQFAGEYQSRLQALLLMNDSCFGTISAAKIEEMGRSPEDLTGVSDSFQKIHHLQSFFILCHGELLAKGKFCELLRSYIFPSSKKDAIDHGELRLSEMIGLSGARLSPSCDYFGLAGLWLQNLPAKMAREKAIYRSLGFSTRMSDEAVEAPFARILTMLRQQKPLNPSHVFWEEILQSGVALVKRGLLLENPADVPDYFSLCLACIETGIVSLDELQQYLSDEAKPPLVSSILRLLSEAPGKDSGGVDWGRECELTHDHSRPN